MPLVGLDHLAGTLLDGLDQLHDVAGGIIDPAFDALKGATVGALAIDGYSPLRNPDPVRQPGGGMCYPASHIIMTNKCEDG